MALIASVELLTFRPQSERGIQMFDALQPVLEASSVQVTRGPRYRGGSDLLGLWGPGAPDRFSPMSAQVANGGHVVAFDLAYTQRAQKIRCSIDAAHPQAWVMCKDWPADRLTKSEMSVSDRWDPAGHVLIAGIGPKAKVQYGARTVEAWELEMIQACQARRRVVWYRRKNGRGDMPAGVVNADTGTIEAALDGASLLVTWHSNVAVDAIRAGIPVMCRDGAAAAVCPSVLSESQRPLPVDVRDRFLTNLSYFQWAPSEAAHCWRFLLDLLE